ncbi:MAG: hypothetical protein HC767_03960 [Akkermansiaceae bacterium]|nr:hypothetical protein [Akkermansiaceae bacterium]
MHSSHNKETTTTEGGTHISKSCLQRMLDGHHPVESILAESQLTVHDLAHGHIHVFRSGGLRNLLSVLMHDLQVLPHGCVALLLLRLLHVDTKP